MTDASCPCGSAAAYVACCGPLHAGEPAPTALALMRSRYTAFVRGNANYLLQSWHPSTRPAELVLEPGLRWLGLRIVAHEETGEHTATVEFVARSRLGGGSAMRLHERSRFVRERGHWFYIDGTALR